MRPGSLLIAACLCSFPSTSRVAGIKTAILHNATPYKLLDTGVDPGASWPLAGYDDGAWKDAYAPLSSHPDSGSIVTTASKTPPTVYLRAVVDLPFDPKQISSLRFPQLFYACGFILYVNGKEAHRQNMPEGPVTFKTPSRALAAKDLPADVDVTRSRDLWVKGKNTVALELHRMAPGTPVVWWATLEFDTLKPRVTRGPYLQIGTPDSMVLRWRTNVPTESQVAYGTAAGALGERVKGKARTTEHAVVVTGLKPDTRYFYSVGTPTEALAGGDDAHFFFTAPAPGSPKAVRIWVVGDSGEGNVYSNKVRDAYVKDTKGACTDLLLMLGDNAYQNGTDRDHQFGIFEGQYEDVIRNTVMWPTLGNHDKDNSDPETETGPYFVAFTLPKGGEAGGFPSGNEDYCSFDYGSLHVICLNTESHPAGMTAWLKKDLARAKSEWLIAFFHEPVYSHGSHDSDQDESYDRIRREYVKTLESHGVDLVLGGHSHHYERSVLINGHYGPSSEFRDNPKAFAVDGGDGREGGRGAYRKPPGLVPNKGTVYVVCGVSSALKGDSSLDHPVNVPLKDPYRGDTRRGLYVNGSVAIDVKGPRLDARFIDLNGNVLDRFTILKAKK